MCSVSSRSGSASVPARSRSKLDRYGEHLFVVVQPAQYDDAAETVECHEVDLFVGEDFFIAISPDGQVDLEKLRCCSRSTRGARPGPYGVRRGPRSSSSHGAIATFSAASSTTSARSRRQLFGDDDQVSHRIFARCSAR
ncbi:MAG: hypothetical protein R2692_03620 [Microbacterium sp.]